MLELIPSNEVRFKQLWKDIYMFYDPQGKPRGAVRLTSKVDELPETIIGNYQPQRWYKHERVVIVVNDDGKSYEFQPVNYFELR